MRSRLIVLLGLVALALPLSASAQSVAEAARKAREKKGQPAKSTRVFTNDNVASGKGTVSTLGAEPAAATDPSAAAGKAPADQKEDPNSEKAWRAKFSDARKRLSEAEKELDLLQRELNLNQVQHYDDPTKALNEQFRRDEINSHRQKLEDKRKEIASIKQQIADLEDELRKAGLPASWSRE